MDYQENPLDRKGGLRSKSLLSLNMNLCVIYCLPNKKIVLIALFIPTDLLRFLYETLTPLSKNKKTIFTTATPLLTPLTQPWLVLSLLCLHYVLLRSLKTHQWILEINWQTVSSVITWIIVQKVLAKTGFCLPNFRSLNVLGSTGDRSKYWLN